VKIGFASAYVKMLIDTVDTSAPEGRRYGEPDWESRPVQYRMYGGTGLFGDPGMRDARDFPKYTEQSYEEWMVEGYIEM